MNSYLIGNLLGRLAVSYVLVWLLMWGLSRFDVKGAFGNTRRWYGRLLITLVFVLGVGAGLKSGALG